MHQRVYMMGNILEIPCSVLISFNPCEEEMQMDQYIWKSRGGETHQRRDITNIELRIDPFMNRYRI